MTCRGIASYRGVIIETIGDEVAQTSMSSWNLADKRGFGLTGSFGNR
jgi:hypothetical protein